jgi:hypothetical protein
VAPFSNVGTASFSSVVDNTDRGRPFARYSLSLVAAATRSMTRMPSSPNASQKPDMGAAGQTNASCQWSIDRTCLDEQARVCRWGLVGLLYCAV